MLIYLPNYSRTNKLETKVICALVQKAATPPCLGSWEVEQQGKDRRGPEGAPGKAQKGVWAHIKVPTWPVSSLAYHLDPQYTCCSKLSPAPE